MSELTLTFEDENGTERRFSVRRETFVIGRHSGCDLSIADGRLSREHLKIERFGDLFVATDLGSSNGTMIGGRKLQSPTRLQNGDSLNLGGLEFRITLGANNYGAKSAAYFDDDDDSGEAQTPQAEKKVETPSPPSNAPPVSSNASPPADSGSFPRGFFIIAPLLGLVVLLLVGGALFMLGGDDKTEIVSSGNEFVYSNDDEPDEPKNSSEENKNADQPTNDAPVNSVSQSNGNQSSEANSPVSSNAPTPTPANLSETAKIEANSASFLRKIAQNDPNAFLTGEQAKLVGAKIKQIGAVAAIADNIKSARANAAQIQSLANAKNLRPQFLAVAAMARLGGARGNVLQTAQGMVENLDKLLIHVGNERADDALLMIAAFDQSSSGRVLDFRNMLQKLSNEVPESSRTIRTIWFLRQKGKISEAEYEFALRFLAIGTITQNPKDFAVNAEELKLN